MVGDKFGISSFTWGGSENDLLGNSMKEARLPKKT